MLGLLKYPGDDFQKSVGLNQLWFKDTGATAHLQNNTGFGARQQYIIQTPDPNGTFLFRVPLKHIFGFCDDYDKVVYGFKHQLTLVRKGDYDAMFRNNAVDAGKVVLTKFSWYVPHVLPALEQKLVLYKIIESKASLPVRYRMIQCDSIPFPQARTSIFDHCNLTNMFVMLNSRRYPENDYNGNNFTQQKISRVYGDAAAFRKKFYGLEELVSSPNIHPSDFKDFFPMFVFDVTKQSEKLKNLVTDIQIKAQSSENVAANTEAFAVVINDKSLIFQSDGQKMRVEY